MAIVGSASVAVAVAVLGASGCTGKLAPDTAPASSKSTDTPARVSSNAETVDASVRRYLRMDGRDCTNLRETAAIVDPCLGGFAPTIEAMCDGLGPVTLEVFNDKSVPYPQQCAPFAGRCVGPQAIGVSLQFAPDGRPGVTETDFSPRDSCDISAGPTVDSPDAPVVMTATFDFGNGVSHTFELGSAP